MPIEVISKLIESLPVAGAIIFVVWMFLQYRKSEAEMNQKATGAMREAFEGIAGQQFKLQEETNKTLRENIKIQTEHVEVLRELRRELHERRSVA